MPVASDIQSMYEVTLVNPEGNIVLLHPAEERKLDNPITKDSWTNGPPISP